MKSTYYLVLITLITLFTSCSVTQQISKQADTILIKDSSIKTGHIGISIYEPATGKYWYNHNADKYFVPASNTKLFALYAGMKYLGDSLPGIKYSVSNQDILIQPTGDPTFLHPDFKTQKVINFLRSQQRPVTIINNNWRANALGFGWAWDDYNSNYMAERSPFPIYGNVINWIQVKDKPGETNQEGNLVYSEPDVTWKVNFSEDTTRRNFSVRRNRAENVYQITFGNERRKEQSVPFVTNGVETAVTLLKDTLNLSILANASSTTSFKILRSQPSDSLFKIMMHRSDNFFAEQTLLMASNEKLGYMSDERMIDHILNTDLKDIPQKPKWVDGSGLSRYNLFTPHDFIYILQKLKNDFGIERVKAILPTGGTGTLSSVYKQDSGYIFAKTGP